MDIHSSCVWSLITMDVLVWEGGSTSVDQGSADTELKTERSADQSEPW